MKVNHIGGRRALFSLFDARVIIASVGILLSVVLHELFHMLVHFGNVVSFGFLNGSHAIAHVTVSAPAGYDVNFEEFIAYTITFSVLLMTAIVIWSISDSKDSRSFARHLLPKHSDMHGLSSDELYALVDKAGLFSRKPS